MNKEFSVNIVLGFLKMLTLPCSRLNNQIWNGQFLYRYNICPTFFFLFLFCALENIANKYEWKKSNWNNGHFCKQDYGITHKLYICYMFHQSQRGLSSIYLLVKIKMVIPSKNMSQIQTNEVLFHRVCSSYTLHLKEMLYSMLVLPKGFPVMKYHMP